MTQKEETIKLLYALAELPTILLKDVTLLKYAAKQLELVGCGCDLCLVHNNMKCPKLNQAPVE